MSDDSHLTVTAPAPSWFQWALDFPMSEHRVEVAKERGVEDREAAVRRVEDDDREALLRALDADARAGPRGVGGARELAEIDHRSMRSRSTAPP